MGKRYESKRNSVKENRESAQSVSDDRKVLSDEYSFMSAIDGLLSDIDDEVGEAIVDVENVGDTESERLTSQAEEIEKEKEELSAEIEEELEKLEDGMSTLSKLDSYSFGKKSVAGAKVEYKKQIDKYRDLLDELGNGTKGAGDSAASDVAGITSEGVNDSNNEKGNDAVEDNHSTIPGVSFSNNVSQPGGTGDGNIEASNEHPKEDIKNAFDFADQNYDKNSAHWQENANREVEVLDHELANLSNDIDALKRNRDVLYNDMSAYITQNGFTQEQLVNDATYNSLKNGYIEIDQQLSSVQNKYNQINAQRQDIASNIDASSTTTYKGRGGTDFIDSYNGIITDPQGQTVPGYGGTCGINHECSVVNQQTGSNLGEDYGIRYSIDHGLCKTGGSYAENGGTNAIYRSQFLADHGVTFQRIEGEKDTGMELSLDMIAQKFNSGDSAGIMLKAQDLSQPELSSRQYKLGNIRHNKTRYNANHATTIAGFSYDNNGSVTGVWINDTGGWAGSNRVFIDKEKFNQMQKNTIGFAIEFSRRA